MLFRVEVENFYSIRDRQVIDLLAAENAPEIADRLVPAWRNSELRAPKVIAVFGPNASGKSNLLKALGFTQWFIKDSFSFPLGARLPFERFNNEETIDAPTRLAVHLGGLIDPTQDGAKDECAYMYEVTLGGPNSEQTVSHEALFYWPRGKKTRLFERDANGNVVASKAFDLSGHRQALETVLRSNASVVSTLAQLKHPFALALWEAASRVLTNILLESQDGVEDQMIRYYAANPNALEALNHELERIDLGLKSMEITNGAAGLTAMFSHVGLTHKMPLKLQSYGTRQFVRVFPVLWYALQTGGIAIIDELDTAIHPLVLPEVLRWFYDRRRNAMDAQLWLSCHNASLLECLAKEEILFCEKDHEGRSHIFGLKDVRAVRRSDNYYKKYLGGVYGAIPKFG